MGFIDQCANSVQGPLDLVYLYMSRESATSLFLAAANLTPVRGVIHRLQLPNLPRAQPDASRDILKRDNGLGNGPLQTDQLVLGALEVNLGIGRERFRVHDVNLGREGSTHEQHARPSEFCQVRGHEEATEREGAAGHAREEDVGRVEGHHLREHIADEIAHGEGVGGAVVAGEARGGAGPLAPEEVLGGGEDDYAEEVALHGLVGEVEEGLAAVSVQEDVEAGLAGGVWALARAGDVG